MDQGCLGNVGRRKRKRQILALDYEWPKTSAVLLQSIYSALKAHYMACEALNYLNKKRWGSHNIMGPMEDCGIYYRIIIKHTSQAANGEIGRRGPSTA
jgi:hypothetical protein